MTDLDKIGDARKALKSMHNKNNIPNIIIIYRDKKVPFSMPIDRLMSKTDGCKEIAIRPNNAIKNTVRQIELAFFKNILYNY